MQTPCKHDSLVRSVHDHVTSCRFSVEKHMHDNNSHAVSKVAGSLSDGFFGTTPQSFVSPSLAPTPSRE